MKRINIEQKQITVVSRIEVGGKEYPLHARNIDYANDYLRTKDEKFLDKLVDFSLDF
jgi:hypothetical protein